ncbi:MAG TPA: HlyD family secretion protein [Candidatus Methylacidiphilales bacterium]|jgi:membrane fusion protein (multidrug efflux system)|nr:HlyD family secretion protein [Candidatus Methylacidiphilales bacterium]
MSTSTLEDEVALSDKKPGRPAPSPVPALKQKLHPLIERHKKTALIAAGIAALIVVLFYACDAWTHEETDDAYVTGHLHDASSRINGVVTDVLVDDNQFVRKGDVLVKLDPMEYQALAAAAKADLDVAQSNLDRLQPLIASHAIAPEDVDKARSTRDVDLAQYELAELQIVYSTIEAPADGYVGRKNVEVGNRVSSGQTLMVVVEPDLWIVGNFKETQLAHMRRGQPVRISIDSIPDKVFDGKVDSFSPATGNEFALLPADNSTGNFTKIVQRVPVKIVFNPDSIRGYEKRIRAGESAVVKVALTAH